MYCMSTRGKNGLSGRGEPRMVRFARRRTGRTAACQRAALELRLMFCAMRMSVTLLFVSAKNSCSAFTMTHSLPLGFSAALTLPTAPMHSNTASRDTAEDAARFFARIESSQGSTREKAPHESVRRYNLLAMRYQHAVCVMAGYKRVARRVGCEMCETNGRSGQETATDEIAFLVPQGLPRGPFDADWQCRTHL